MQDFVNALNKEDLTLNISPQGMADLVINSDASDPDKNLLWTTDARVELPIIMKKFGQGSETPITLMDQWKITLAEHADKPALSQKIDGQWQFMTYNEYYEASMKFAAALTRANITERTSVTVLSYNCAEWHIAFNGTIFANLVSCGLYITNQPEACKYVIENCDSEICIVENQDYLHKILPVWDQLPNLKQVVVISDNFDLGEYSRYSDRVTSYREFINFEMTQEISDALKARISAQAPGHCCSLVYTSGTTGNPKGVMLSHDNYTWINTVLKGKLPFDQPSPRIVSFLPLSHVAAQYADILLPLGLGAHVFFADAMALRGTLIDYLLDVRPNLMLAVPRLYEKMEEKVRAALQEKPRIMKWALEVNFHLQILTFLTFIGW
jgi:long-chain-fatty-acid--CoA ligase ACSBG